MDWNYLATDANGESLSNANDINLFLMTFPPQQPSLQASSSPIQYREYENVLLRKNSDNLLVQVSLTTKATWTDPLQTPGLIVFNLKLRHFAIFVPLPKRVSYILSSLVYKPAKEVIDHGGLGTRKDKNLGFGKDK